MNFGIAARLGWSGKGNKGIGRSRRLIFLEGALGDERGNGERFDMDRGRDRERRTGLGRKWKTKKKRGGGGGGG